MLTNKQYDFLKWVVAIVLPAFATLVSTIGQAVGWGSTELVVLIINAIMTFLGSIFMFSSSTYKGPLGPGGDD